ELVHVDLLEANALVLRRHPVGGHFVVWRTSNPAPILVAIVAALSRDGGNLVDVALDLEAVDLRVLRIGKRPAEKLIVRQPQRRLVVGTAAAPRSAGRVGRLASSVSSLRRALSRGRRLWPRLLAVEVHRA